MVIAVATQVILVILVASVVPVHVVMDIDLMFHGEKITVVFGERRWLETFSSRKRKKETVPSIYCRIGSANPATLLWVNLPLLQSPALVKHDVFGCCV